MSTVRAIPSIEQLRQQAGLRALEHEYGRETIVGALREVVAALRAEWPTDTQSDRTPPSAGERAAVMRQIEQAVRVRLQQRTAPSLRAVVNATGVVVHTNLGRAPLAEPAARALAALTTGYTNLEYDLAEGRRGRRDVHAERLLCRLTGAEAAVVVNNNAAATLLILAALAHGREVLVSRGELVEIGGGFRVPEVMAQSGAILREVGTTNKTRLADYAAALNDRAALILRVHRSNFRIEGFTEQPGLAALVALGRERGVPVVEDLGGGYLGLPGEAGGAALDDLLGDEPKVQTSVAAGVDVVCFSGDKLLGGPQAGIVLGRASLVSRIRTHPLMRALRVDKMVYAALESTLSEYVAGRASRTVPVARMLLMSVRTIGERAEALARRLEANSALRVELFDGFSTVGGGAAPGLQIPTRLVGLSAPAAAPDRLEAALRDLSPPVIARIERDRVVLDLRTVFPEQDAQLAESLAALKI